MPSPKSTRPNDDVDRRVQQFLERAAPIVLEDPSLTAERWRQLSAIASDYHLTADEFQTTLDDLVARGVLRHVDTTLPKPPPLPRGRAVEPRPTPPVRQAAVPPARNNFASPVRTLAESSEITRDDLEPNVEPPTPAMKETSPAPDISVKETPRPNIAQPRPDSNEISPTHTDKIDGRWRIEGAPTPVPTRPTKKPHEIYVDFVRQSLTYVNQGEISQAVEQRLIQHGTRVLSLSAVYARHLLQQIAAEIGFQLKSQQSDQGIDPSTENPDRPVWENPDEALPGPAADRGDQSVATVAEHGSKVRIAEPKSAGSASEPLRKQAAATVNYLQLERVVPLREYVHATLDRLPRGLLPLQLLDKLISAGVDQFGVNDDLVLETIRHVASELKITVVTKDQAEEHVSALVGDLLDIETALAAEHLEQIRQSGIKWGLSVAQIDAVVQQVNSAKRALRRREEITTRLALAAAAIAVLLVVSFIGYAFITAQSDRRSATPPPTSSEQPP
jgi:hypothetical protein